MTTIERLPELIDRARDVRSRAHAPYSKYRVGAALLTESGEIFAGCNVENSSYGLTVCAERSAACQAIAHGHRNFLELVIVTVDGAPPCGACRQFLSEFGSDLSICLVNENTPDEVTRTNLKDLFPNPFV